MEKLHWKRLNLEGAAILTRLMLNHCSSYESDPSSRSGCAKIVLFLHGYGSNGDDLISLKDYISIDQPVEFISPNAPETCELNFFGYQWFPLKERTK